jgi:hypothetical protein
MEPNPVDTTLAPDVSTTPDTAPDPARELEALRAKYERAQADIRKFRTRADEVETERLQKAGLEEQVTAYKTRAEEAERKAQEAEAARLQSARIASLTGKVADPKAALKLLEDEHLTADGDVNVDALLKAYPFLAFKSAGVNIPGSRSASEPDVLKPDDFRGKSPAWIEANLHRLKPSSPNH